MKKNKQISEPMDIDKVKENEKENEKEKEKEKEKEQGQIYNDQCTAFISNLHLDTKEEHIRSFFGDNGGITAIRLLRDKFTGKPRGLAYVDFSDDKHLEEAISKNKSFLLERKLSIARSDPSNSRNSQSSRASSSRGRGGRRMPNKGRKNEEENPNPKNGGERESEGVKREKVTFAAPRALLAKPLGWNKRDGTKVETSGEELKSNHAFRDLLLKK